MKNLILCIHNHQPVGNFTEVFEKAIYNSYLPFLEELLNFPEIKICLHTSGCLFEFLEDHNLNDYFDLMKALLAQNQLEIISGGFYEPLLFLLPDEDKINSIKRMNTYISNKFKVTPKGIWLTERVWEPGLAKPIHQADIDYTLIDDHAFKKVGLTENDLYHYYITEEQGYTLKIFPILKKLRYLLPYHEPKDLIDFLDNTPEEADFFTYGDDGEKFGLWPGTYERVYKEGWLKRFFSKLVESEKYQTIFLKDALQKYPPKSRIYLPPSSYEEMEDWALNASKQLQFVEKKNKTLDDEKQFSKGGYFRNFFLKYPEANKMHKRMLYVGSKTKNPNELSYNHYLRSQCNCAYWHGIFGGLYLPHLRNAIYKELILADKVLNQTSALTITDFDKDGQLEYIFSNEYYSTFIHLGGGRVIEIDAHKRNTNLTNVMSRYYEAYHQPLLKGDLPRENSDTAKTIHDGLMIKDSSALDYLHFDNYTRENFLDHYLNHPEDIVNSHPDLSLYKIEDIQDNSITLTSSSGMIKKYRLQGSKIELDLTIPGNSNYYALELNLALLEAGSITQVDSGSLIYEHEGYYVYLKSDKIKYVRTIPIHTVSNSESGIEKIYQGMTFYFFFPLMPNVLNKINFSLESK